MSHRKSFQCWLAAVATAGFLQAPFVALAQTVGAGTVSWDCWLSLPQVISIRCIAAREGMPPADPARDDMETVLLDHIHTLIHSGHPVDIDGVVSKNIEVFHEGSIWTIRVWNIPYDSSWAEDRPARLVRAVLCPAGVTCNVLVVRP
jgi:hypothetical protein